MTMDISKKAHQIARVLDRLEPGEYTLKLIKPAGGDGSYWELKINSDTTKPIRKVFGDYPIHRNKG